MKTVAPCFIAIELTLFNAEAVNAVAVNAEG